MKRNYFISSTKLSLDSFFVFFMELVRLCRNYAQALSVDALQQSIYRTHGQLKLMQKQTASFAPTWCRDLAAGSSLSLSTADCQLPACLLAGLTLVAVKTQVLPETCWGELPRVHVSFTNLCFILLLQLTNGKPLITSNQPSNYQYSSASYVIVRQKAS